MSACFVDRSGIAEVSPGSVSNSVERVLEVRVFGEVAGVIGILQHRSVSRGWCIVVAVAVAVRGGGIDIVFLRAEVNAKPDGQSYNGEYSDTCRDELGIVSGPLCY